MVKAMRVSFKMTSARAEECSSGGMGACTTACGKMVSSMALAFSIAKTIKLSRASGRMVRKSGGSKMSDLLDRIINYNKFNVK